MGRGISTGSGGHRQGPAEAWKQAWSSPLAAQPATDPGACTFSTDTNSAYTAEPAAVAPQGEYLTAAPRGRSVATSALATVSPIGCGENAHPKPSDLYRGRSQAASATPLGAVVSGFRTIHTGGLLAGHSSSPTGDTSRGDCRQRRALSDVLCKDQIWQVRAAQEALGRIQACG
jgi:hypothetical protein